jgi:hypothetical protein
MTPPGEETQNLEQSVAIYGIDLKALIKDSLWATLVFYLMLVELPKVREVYLDQLMKQRQDFFEQQTRYDDRRDAQLKTIEAQCHISVQENLTLTRLNHRLIVETHDLLTGNVSAGKP